MCALAMARVRLKRALPFHGTLPKVIEPSILAKAFRECQSRESVLQSASFPEVFRPVVSHVRLVSSQSFPHLWKKLWKFAKTLGYRAFRGAGNRRFERSNG